MKSKQELVKVLTGDVIRSVSPEEDILIESFDPGANVDGQSAKGPRGLGAEVALALLLPYIYRFFEKAIDRMATKAADSVVDALTGWIRGSKSDIDPVLVQVVQQELQQAGLEKSKAIAAAPAILKALVQHREALVASK